MIPRFSIYCILLEKNVLRYRKVQWWKAHDEKRMMKSAWWCTHLVTVRGGRIGGRWRGNVEEIEGRRRGMLTTGNGVTQSPTCCTMWKSGWVAWLSKHEGWQISSKSHHEFEGNIFLLIKFNNWGLRPCKQVLTKLKFLSFRIQLRIFSYISFF